MENIKKEILAKLVCQRENVQESWAYAIQMAVHQDRTQYGRSPGMQCTSNTYLAIITKLVKMSVLCF